MDTGLNKPSNRSSAISEHLSNKNDSANTYCDSFFILF